MLKVFGLHGNGGKIVNTYLDMHIELRQIKDGFSSEFDQRKSWIRRIIKSVFSVREEKKNNL